MIWTHVYDLALKLIVLFLSIFLFTSLPVFDDHVIVLIITSFAVSIIFYIFFLRTLGSYLYSRFTLKMPVSFAQAKQLNEALAPNPFFTNDLKWLALNEIKELDPDTKYEVALKLLVKWKEQKKEARKLQIEKFKRSSSQSKFFEITLAVLVVLCFVTSFLELPPANLIIKYYCIFFDTNSYSPILIGSILTLIVLFPILLIKKVIENKK